jgi:hypothetical protein
MFLTIYLAAVFCSGFFVYLDYRSGDIDCKGTLIVRVVCVLTPLFNIFYALTLPVVYLIVGEGKHVVHIREWLVEPIMKDKQ